MAINGFVLASIREANEDVAWAEGEMARLRSDCEYAQACGSALEKQRDALRAELLRISPNHPLLPRLRSIYFEGAREYGRRANMDMLALERWLAEIPSGATAVEPPAAAGPQRNAPGPGAELAAAQGRIAQLELELARKDASLRLVQDALEQAEGRVQIARSETALANANAAGVVAQRNALRGAVRIARPDHPLLHNGKLGALFTAAAREQGRRTGMDPERLERWLSPQTEAETGPELPFPGGLK